MAGRTPRKKRKTLVNWQMVGAICSVARVLIELYFHM
jgi:hypothetical protein